MDNSRYRDLYISQMLERSVQSENSAQSFVNFWKRVRRFEIGYNKFIEDGYTKTDFVQLLTSLNASNIACFRPFKSMIRKYVEYLVEDHLLPEQAIREIADVAYEDIDASRLFELKFFKDFASLQDAIETTLTAADKVDARIFATQIAAIYMAWCGLQIEEALALKKSDVNENCIHAGNRTIYPNPTIMDFIKKYRDEVEYYSAAKATITLKYVPSEWLFRSTRSDHIDDPKTMRIFIYNFGKSGDESNLFQYDKVYWSGIYHRAHLYESENGLIPLDDIETMRAVFNESFPSSASANSRLQSYRKFVRYFFPDK